MWGSRPTDSDGLRRVDCGYSGSQPGGFSVLHRCERDDCGLDRGHGRWHSGARNAIGDKVEREEFLKYGEALADEIKPVTTFEEWTGCSRGDQGERTSLPRAIPLPAAMP